ncbi:MAG: Flp pilus assembly protein CpaB [Caulobacteraceae bacterium]
MENLNKKILVISILMALVTSLLLYFYVSGMDNGKDEVKLEDIYVAKVEIPARTVVKDDMIMKVQIPKDVSIPVGLREKNQIVGKLTKERIIKGEPILPERLYNGGKTNMAYIVPKGKRAVTIGVNEVVEVGNFIVPGDYVDIIATFDEASVDMGGRKVYYPKYTKVILQNIQILGIGQDMEVDKKEEKKLPTSATLAVTLEEAEKLVLAEESGVLRLALKPASDTSQVQTNGILRNDLVVPKGKLEF